MTEERRSMHGKTVATLVVTVLVLLAGCGAGGGNGTTPTATDVSGDETPTATPADDGSTATTRPPTTTRPETPAGDVVPGVSAERVNATKLFATHRQVVNRSTAVEQVVDVRNDGPGLKHQTISVEFGAFDESRRSFKVVNETDEETRTWWLNPERSELALQVDNETGTKYISARNDPGTMFGAVYVIGAYYQLPGTVLQQGTYEYTGNVTRDGETYLRLEATGLSQSRFSGGDGSGSGSSLVSDEAETPTDLSGTVLVTPEGAIHSMDLSLSYEEDGSTHSRTFEFTLDRGDSLELTTPSWLTDLPEASGTYQNDGTVYAVEYSSGSTIPEGTEITIKSGYSALGTATLPESVEPGETMYVYATGGPNQNTTVHVSVGSEPDVPSNAMQLEGNRIVLSATFGDVQFSIGPDRTETVN
ncbi:MAG: hypothetical protein ACI9YT_002928 [Halobacteriales archaeon]